MIGRALRLIARFARRFRNSDLYRRAFTSKKFPDDSDARKPKVPTLGDRADVDVRRTSGDEFIMTVRKGKERLDSLQSRLDTELHKHRQKHNYVLDENERPSIGELQKEQLMERLDEIHEEVNSEDE